MTPHYSLSSGGPHTHSHTHTHINIRVYIYTHTCTYSQHILCAELWQSAIITTQRTQWSIYCVHLSLICISTKKQTKLQPYDLVWVYLYTLCLNEWKTTEFVLFAWNLVICFVSDNKLYHTGQRKNRKRTHQKVIGSNLRRKHLFSLNQDNFSS